MISKKLKKVVAELYENLCGYIRKDLVLQKASSGNEAGHQFEGVVFQWLEAMRNKGLVRRPERWIRKRGFSRHLLKLKAEYEFDLFVRPTDNPQEALLIECKTVWLQQVLDRIKQGKEIYDSFVLNAEDINSFFIKLHDISLRQLRKWPIKKVHPVIISTKLLNRLDFSMLLLYGIKVIQPSRQSFNLFLSSLQKFGLNGNNIKFLIGKYHVNTLCLPPLEWIEIVLKEEKKNILKEITRKSLKNYIKSVNGAEQFFETRVPTVHENWKLQYEMTYKSLTKAHYYAINYGRSV